MTRKTFKTRMDKCVKLLEEDITRILPSKFGLMFDGWSEDGVHYIALFAVGPDILKNSVLLGFSPFEDETALSADSQCHPCEG